MGYSAWSDEAFKSVSKARKGGAAREVFRGTRNIDPLMDPKGVKVRESRDSEHHPNSVPIIVAFDVTGSMGDIPTKFAQEWLGSLMRLLVEQGWVTDPQVLFAAVGDAVVDKAPLQIGQFESGLEMDMWLTRLFLEGGGGDAPESYLLPHWFAAHHTSCDAWEKRGKKGYLFSIGDATNKPLDAAQVERVFGYEPGGATADATVVGLAQEQWEVFHVLVTRGREPNVGLLAHWRKLVGEGLLVLDETKAICELMGVVMGLREGSIDAAAGLEILTTAGMDEAAARKVTHA